jgi:ABC-2 type transport system permease protein
MRAAITIALKDLRGAIRDRSAIALSIVAPLGLAFVLTTVIGGADESLDIRLAVVNQDAGPVGQAFDRRVIGSIEEQDVATFLRRDSVDAARRLVENDEVGGVIVLPAGLSDAVRANRAAEIEVIKNPQAEIGGEFAVAIARGYATEVNAVRLSIATVVTQGPTEPGQIQRLQNEASQMAMPARVDADAAASRQFSSGTFFAAGMAVFFLFFTAQIGSVSLLRERREGTLARLLAAPISGRSIVVAKGLYSFVLGLTSMTVLIVSTGLLMGADWGDPIGVAIVVVAGVFAAMGIQSLVTTLAQTDEQAAGYGAIIAVTLGLLGGTFFPLSQAPALVANLTFVTPHAWLMESLGELSGGAGDVTDVLGAAAALILIGLVTGGVAMMRATRLVLGR